MSVSVLEISSTCKKLVEEVGKVVVGKKNMLKYVYYLRTILALQRR